MKGLIFTYGLTYCGAGAALVNPFVGILIYVCFAIVKPEHLWTWSVPTGNYSRLVVIATLLGWSFKSFGVWKLGKARAMCVLLVCLLLWSILSTSVASNKDVAWSFVDKLSKIVLPYVVGITLIQTTWQIKQLAWVISLSYGYLALEFNRLYYSGQFIRGAFTFAGMEEGSIAIGMICASGFTFFYALYQTNLWKKVILFLCTAFTGHVVLFSFSRGGILGLLTMVVVAFAVVKKDARSLFAIILVMILGVRMAGVEVRDRLATMFVSQQQRDASSQSRLDLWSACWETMLENPILGIGGDQWTVDGVQKYEGKIALFSERKEAHTLWLQIGAELGVPGLFMIVMFYVLCMVRLWPYRRLIQTEGGFAGHLANQADRWTSYAACMVIVPLSGFMVSAQFISLEFLEGPDYLVLLGSGILKLHPVSSLSHSPASIA